MTLAHPLALWLLPLIAIPPLVARRRRPRQRRVVSNLYLWEHLLPQDAARLTRRRVNRQWLVALQMAIVAVVVFALGGPAVATSDNRATLVVDTSASMDAKAGSGTRLDLARARARTIVGGLSRRSVVRIVAAGPSSRDLGEYAADDPGLTRILDSITATAGRCDLIDSIRMVTHGSGAFGNVFVISDQARPTVGRAPDVDLPWIHWDTVGEPVENLAITALSARRVPLAPPRGEAFADIANYSARVRSSDVEISRNGTVVAHQTVDLPAHSHRHIVVPLADVEGVIRARLLTSDALAMDNERATVLPPLESIRVDVASADPFLARALSSNHSITIQSEHEKATADVIVCEDCDQIPDTAAGVLIIAAPSTTHEAGPLTVANPHHPLAAAVDVDGIEASVGPSAPVDDQGEVVLRVGGRPAVIAHERDGRRVVDIRIDVGASNLRFDAAFPVLVANSVNWLSGRDENVTDVAPGDPLLWRLPGVPTASVFGPNGRPIPSRLVAGRLSVDDTSTSGVYRVETPTTTRQFAVNAAVETESNLAESAPAAEAPRPLPVTMAQSKLELAPGFLLLAAGVLIIEWWYRRGPRSWRVATTGALLLAAVGVAIPVGRSPVTTIAVLDRSASVIPGAQVDDLARVNGFAATMHPDDRLGVVTFGTDAVVERQPSARVQIEDIRSSLDDSQTNIAAGLRLARALLPRSGTGRIALVSDGRETLDHAEREAANAAAAGVAIDVVPAAIDNHRASLEPTRLNVPSDVELDRPFSISVDVEGAPGSHGHVRLYRDDELVAERDVTVAAHGAGTFAVDDRVASPGMHTYRAIVQSDDDLAARPSEVGGVVLAAGRPTVLCIASSRCTLLQLLAANGFSVVSAQPDAVAARSEAFASYGTVVLDDVSPEALSIEQMAAINEYVERLGGGLLVLGGPRSLTADGYASSTLASVLPVDLRPRRGSRAPALGLVLVFDKSGSMADLANGTSKIEFARRSAMSVLDVLPETDHFGVIAFDSTPSAVAPLAPGHDRHDLAQRLGGITAGGATRLAPAVQMAIGWLKNEAAVSRRQILLVSDGKTTDDDAAQLIAAAATPDVDISAVAIGTNADPSLLRRVVGSRGRVYVANDVSELPRIVAREASLSAAGALVEERVALQGGVHPALAGIELASLPPIGGYVVSAAKPSATNLLRSSLGDPILCVWRSGLGRVGVFTAHFGSAWSASMSMWRQNAQLWSQVARWLERQTTDRRMAIDVIDRDGAVLVVEASASDGRPLHLDEVRAAVRGPAGTATDLILDGVAPGRYEARLPTAGTGAYAISATGVDRDTGIEHHVVRGVYWAADRERAARGVDLAFLRRLAALTGGRVLAPDETPFSVPRPPDRRSLLVPLTALALLLFLIDVATRGRIDVKSLLLHHRRPMDRLPNHAAA